MNVRIRVSYSASRMPRWAATLIHSGRLPTTTTFNAESAEIAEIAENPACYVGLRPRSGRKSTISVVSGWRWAIQRGQSPSGVSDVNGPLHATQSSCLADRLRDRPNTEFVYESSR